MNNIDSILSELEVLSMIQENGKLCMKNGKLSLEPVVNNGGIQGMTSWALLAVKRRFFQDSREYALLAVQNLILRLEIHLRTVMSVNERQNIIQYCKKADQGLSSLQKTYKHDAQCVATIEIISQNLRNITEQNLD